MALSKQVRDLVAKLRRQKSSTTPEARKIRKQLRDLGHYVSKNDTREGKPKAKDPKKSTVKKPAKKKVAKKKKPIKNHHDEEDEDY